MDMILYSSLLNKAQPEQNTKHSQSHKFIVTACISQSRKYFQIFGFILILAGIVTQLAYRQYLDFLDHGLLSIPVLLILTGLVIFLISVCGCCGSLSEHHCLTSTYSWVLGTLFLLQLLIGLIIFNMQTQVGPDVMRLHSNYQVNCRLLPNWSLPINSNIKLRSFLLFFESKFSLE